MGVHRACGEQNNIEPTAIDLVIDLVIERLAPGKGWSDVVFSNHAIDLNGPVAIAMGTYRFTCATSGDKAAVEYTFGYKRTDDGKARIFLHHSSVPYQA